MKRCPECYEAYENSEEFCEMDGRRLMPDPAVSATDLKSAPDSPESSLLKREPVFTGLVGVITGIVICACVFAAQALWSGDADSKEPEPPAYASRMRDPVQSERPEQARNAEPTPAPSEAPSPNPEAESSPESSAPTPENPTVAARLNQGPVSTGARSRDSVEGDRVQTIIEMNDGTVVEVDAAWKDGQGVWYRRGGLVSFVESRRVRAITGKPEAKSSAASSQ